LGETYHVSVPVVALFDAVFVAVFRIVSPWYVVPADNKWFTRVVVAAAIIDALADLDLEYPKISDSNLKELATAKRSLQGGK